MQLIIEHTINIMPDSDPSSTSPAKNRPPRRPGRPAGAPTGEGRRALLDAARAVIAEKGSPRFTVREVAERAGVQPALVNYYFGGKQGLLRAVVAEVASGGVERIQRATRQGGSARDRVRSLVESWVAGLETGFAS